MKHKELFILAVSSANAILSTRKSPLDDLRKKRELQKLVKEAYVQLYLVDAQINKEKKGKKSSNSAEKSKEIKAKPTAKPAAKTPLAKTAAKKAPVKATRKTTTRLAGKAAVKSALTPKVASSSK